MYIYIYISYYIHIQVYTIIYCLYTHIHIHIHVYTYICIYIYTVYSHTLAHNPSGHLVVGLSHNSHGPYDLGWSSRDRLTATSLG